MKRKPFEPGDEVRMVDNGERRLIWAKAPKAMTYWAWKDGECILAEHDEMELVQGYVKPTRQAILEMEEVDA